LLTEGKTVQHTDHIAATLARHAGIPVCDGGPACYRRGKALNAAPDASLARRCSNCDRIVRGTCTACRAVVIAAIRYAITGELP
jgi:hypothetical protein